MLNNNINIKAGKLFCWSTGEYSDYQYIGHFLALVNIDSELQIQESKGIDRKNRQYRSMAGLLLPELIRSGVVMSIDVQEIHGELTSWGVNRS